MKKTVKKWGVLLGVALLASSGIAADLAIKPYFVREGGVVSMVVRLTNTGSASVRLPTEGYSLDIPDADDLRIGLVFEMPAFEHDKESWAYVPSVQRMGLVELRVQEHAVIQVPLVKGLARKVLDPNASYDVRYKVDAAFAKRFGFWSGETAATKQPSPFKENSDVVMLQDDKSSIDGGRQLNFLPSVAVPGLGVGDKGITIDPSTLPKVGDKVTIRPAPGSGLRRRVTGEFGGVAGSMVTVGKRRYYILDIHPSDRKKFMDWADYHRN